MKLYSRSLFLAGFLCAVPTLHAAAQQHLSLERIFASGDFRIRGVAPAWLADGERYTLVEAGERNGTDLFVEGIRTGKRERLIEGTSLLVEGEKDPLEIEDYSWSKDEQKLLIFSHSERVWRDNTRGRFYVYDVATRKVTPVSRAAGLQQFAKFSPDGTKVAFVRANNLFVVDLTTGSETQLTRDGSPDIINGTTDWAYEEELGLRDAFRWSPDSRRIAFWRFDQSDVKPFPIANELSQYPEIMSLRYPKAGTANSRVQLGVIPATGGTVTWLNVGDDAEQYLARMEWAESTDELIVQRLNRHQNRLDVLMADANTGSTRALFTETDSAWVDVDDDLHFVGNGRQFIWTSERDGWNHLYLYNRDGSLVRQITRGAWEVTSVYGVDPKSGYVYFAATEQGPGTRHIYRIRLNGSGMQRISQEPGTHAADFSPNFALYVDAYSTMSRPPVFTLRSADGKVIRTLEDNARVAQQLQQANLSTPEFFDIRTSDGATLKAWMLKPMGFDPARKYPVLMYVYGGPGSQTVTDAWGGSRYLWHQFMAQRGYVVVSVDNRGTGARGRDFKKLTYLNLGKWETNDQIEAARWLGTLPYVDASRIGIWGWSYGGYMTSLTLERAGRLFKAGVAVAPVADWQLYDTIYTERFMRTPQENRQGYHDSAPVNNVAGLASRFLLIHGTGDDNVHFQNSIQLTNALQAAGKQFQFMMYPNRTHSISGGNTQFHLFTLMTNWVDENLAGSAKPTM